jgi:hypothetical protein
MVSGESGSAATTTMHSVIMRPEQHTFSITGEALRIAEAEAVAELRDADWRFPQRGPAAELGSLAFQAGRRPPPVPSDAFPEYDVDAFLERYPTTSSLGIERALQTEAGIRTKLESLWHSLKPDSSPGLPFMLLSSTNKGLENWKSVVLATAVARIWLLSRTPVDVVRGLSPVELVQGNFADVLRLFVKNEPHNALKTKQGRYRLIASVSVVMQLTERFFATTQNKVEISLCDVIPSKPGIGFSDSQLAPIRAALEGLEVGGHTTVCTDLSGFDWSLDGWWFDQEAEFRVRLCKAGPLTERLIRNHMRILSNSVFALSDGRLYAQTHPGIMKSGSYLTSSSNSRIRVLMAYLRGAESIAMGDDCVEQSLGHSPDQIKAYYASLGLRVKFLHDTAEKFSFCSQTFWRDGGVEPESWSKTLYRYLAGERDEAKDHQYAYEMRHSPHLGWINRRLRTIGWLVHGTRTQVSC